MMEVMFIIVGGGGDGHVFNTKLKKAGAKFGLAHDALTLFSIQASL